MPLEHIENPPEVPQAAKVLNFLSSIGLYDAVIVGQESVDGLHEGAKNGRICIYTSQPQDKGPLAEIMRSAKDSPFREWAVGTDHVSYKWNAMSLVVNFRPGRPLDHEQLVAAHGVGLTRGSQGKGVNMLCTPTYSMAREERIPYTLA
jgi:hypothetical protein